MCAVAGIDRTREVYAALESSSAILSRTDVERIIYEIQQLEEMFETADTIQRNRL